MRAGPPRPAAPPAAAHGGAPQPSYGDGQGYGDGGDARRLRQRLQHGPGLRRRSGGRRRRSRRCRRRRPAAPRARTGGAGSSGRRSRWSTVLVVSSVGTYFWADSKLNREVDLSKVIERPEEGEGTNYLIVGSDSREGMSAEEKKKLHTGSAEGKRTDSMMILHDRRQRPDADLAARVTRTSRSRPSRAPSPARRYPAHGPPGQAERRVRRGRPRAAGPHGRVQHRPAHRPLRGDRLRRLREHRGRGRRRGDGHPDRASRTRSPAPTSRRASRP